MPTVPNQRKVYIHREKCEKEREAAKQAKAEENEIPTVKIVSEVKIR